jgi:hypothetical protein
MQVLQNDWTEPAGWALIAAGLALALWTLGEKSRSRLGPALDRRAHGAATRHACRIEPGSEWQRLVDIVEGGLARTETLVDAQARAVEEIEAADGAVGRLLAECAAFMPSGAAILLQGRAIDLQPASEPVARPLAA